jgi:hypothetical protein
MALDLGPEPAVFRGLGKYGVRMKTLLRFASLICVPLIVAACSQPINFKGGNAGILDSASCQNGTTTANKPTKFLFIVDQSGSNLDGPYEHPGQATDPSKTFRYGVISEFVQKHGGKSTINWGFISLRSPNAQSMISGFGDTAAMNTALQTFLSTPDAGDTPYKSALQLARDTIAQDLGKNGTVTFQYRIAFLTDGYPTDYCTDPTLTLCPGAMQETALDNDVQSVINAAPGLVQMSTVYYGLPDSVASARLQRMAAKGNGQFVDTNVTKTINLDDVMKVPVNCN